jgi:hypothetical protein
MQQDSKRGLGLESTNRQATVLLRDSRSMIGVEHIAHGLVFDGQVVDGNACLMSYLRRENGRLRQTVKVLCLNWRLESRSCDRQRRSMFHSKRSVGGA